MRIAQGRFLKIGYAHSLDLYLAKNMPARPMGRYNRPGQDALYLSTTQEAAEGALRNSPPSAPRILIEYDVRNVNAFDVRDLPETDRAAFVSPWKPLVKAGDTPASWGAADKLRQKGFDGLIDPSRANPHLWHLVLFRWNEANAPTVTLSGTTTL